MSTSYQKPIPLKNQDNHPYWDAADRHRLSLQKCNACGQFAHPPGPACSKCGSTDLIWIDLGSDIKGSVHSYIISYRPYLPGFHEQLPYVVAVVALDDVPEVTIIGNILDCPAEEVNIGMTVRMKWVDISEERAIPQWARL